MRKILLFLTLMLATPAIAADNYTATQGAGTTFGAKDFAGVLYPRQVMCDPTTVLQCVAVDASGRITLVPNQAMNNAQWNGVALGSPSAYGTSPGAVNVPGVNAFVTNTLAAMANNADAVAASTANVSPVGAFPFLWNGTTWDRWKSAGSTGVAAVRQSDGTNVAQINPCQSEVQTTVPFTLATAAVKVAITGVSAKKIYVCAYDLNNNAADSVAIFEATTATVCATAAVAVIGAGTSVATAATGYNWSANGGVSRGTGGFQVMQTSVNANDLCIAQSAATQLSGTFTYVTR